MSSDLPEGAANMLASDPNQLAQLGKGWSNPVVGVLGGVGPAATATFLDVLVRATRSSTDQGHIDALVAQHSTVPDRTAHILDPDNHPDPGPVLAQDARMLQAAGVDLLVLPCNTAHHYSEHIMRAIDIPLLSIVETTAHSAAEVVAHSGAPVAIFATEGNVRAEVYQRDLDALGSTPMLPSRPVQDMINTVIYDQVKAGQPVDLGLFDDAVAQMIDAGAGAVILGCTELSVVFDQYGYRGDKRLVDSLTELARATVRAVGKELSPAFS
ncbi:cysteate racemase [Devriesea agamarum]|uniref:aspartate/glutamate racemase family protein n=1 Tax=Devriesea agamarum TaxID=472569 RepID=UPI000A63E62C|nr:amino acid racemase [Devriesea agamarum]